MKNLFSKKMVEQIKFNELFFNLASGLFIGYLTGLILFIMSNSNDNTEFVISVGIIIGIVTVHSVYIYEYKAAALTFSVILPLITVATYLRLGLNLDILDLTGLYLFLQGLFTSVVLSSIFAYYHHKYSWRIS